MYENLEKHFSPNESIVSYDKLIKLCKHQIKLLEEERKKIEHNATYYVLQEPQAIKDYHKLIAKQDEWEWLLDVLINRYEIVTL